MQECSNLSYFAIYSVFILYVVQARSFISPFGRSDPRHLFENYEKTYYLQINVI